MNPRIKQRTMLTRIAAVRFGEGTAARLSALLGRMDDARLGEAGKAVIESVEGAELLDRAGPSPPADRLSSSQDMSP